MEKEEAETVEKAESAAREEDEPQKTTSLFPVVQQQPSDLSKSSNSSVPQWLSNPSFTTDLSLINDAVSRYEHQQHLPSEYETADAEDEEVEGRTANKQQPPPTYGLVESSASDFSSFEDNESGKRNRKNKKKRKRRKRSHGAAAPYEHGLPSERRPDVRSWTATSFPTTSTKEYYFDSHGDRDNLEFGCLYRMDLARYKLQSSVKSSELKYYQGLNQRNLGFDDDQDVEALDSKLKSGGRYWSTKYTALERHKNLKRIRIVAPEKTMPSVDGDFIPLSVDNDKLLTGASVVEESWEDEVLRKTRDFNRMTRENPHDGMVWLEFAELQDRVASMQPQKGARLQTLEKKISILEKAIELNPDNEELLITLMNAYQCRDNTDVLIGRWEKILVQHPGNFKLWRNFLRVVQGEFSRFKVSDVRRIYANAIQALSAACSKLSRQFHQSETPPFHDPAVLQQELALVDIFICLCRFEWQSGYKELATALFQAEIEYSLFAPSLLLTEQSKHRLFEYFWNSSGARVGEDGAHGWATWLEKEEEQTQKVINEVSSHKSEEGGWTGWSKPLSKSKEVNQDSENAEQTDVSFVEAVEESETQEDEHKDDTEALLKMLGIDGDDHGDTEVKDTKIWARWSEEELLRDSDQWIPVHAKSAGISHSNDIADSGGELLRVILFEDVSEYLFSIGSEAARESLVSQFVEFYDGRISQWTSTNSSSWIERTHGLEDLPDYILDDLRIVQDVSFKKESIPSSVSLESLVGSSETISTRTNMMRFLRNALLLCLTIFPCNHILQEAALVSEELSNTRMSLSNCSVTPCRALAKGLLKANRQDVLLCGVYARREAAFGNINHARKVFDMALSSIEGLPPESRSHSSVLYLWYAEVELANSSGGSSESSSRAMHILSCLGSGIKYCPFKCQTSSVQQLRARQGFKEKLKMPLSMLAHGVVEDRSIALICSAALFEELTTGLAAGVEVLDQAFSTVLPEKRSQSYQVELLLNYYVRMLCRHHEQSKVAKLWDSILLGLQIYPFSPKFYNAFTCISQLHTTSNKVRRIFDNYCHKKPSVVVWLFALSFEISRGSSNYRVHRLFERALAEDKFHNSVILWRLYIAYELYVAHDPAAARRVYFRAIHACPWSKKLWLDGFLKLNLVLTAKELSDLQEVMRDKELNVRTDIYEILLQDEEV